MGNSQARYSLSYNNNVCVSSDVNESQSIPHPCRSANIEVIIGCRFWLYLIS